MNIEQFSPKTFRQHILLLQLFKWLLYLNASGTVSCSRQEDSLSEKEVCLSLQSQTAAANVAWVNRKFVYLKSKIRNIFLYPRIQIYRADLD